MRSLPHFVSRNAFVVLFSSYFLFGCQSKPIQEMVFADTAMRSAQKAKADVYATKTFRKAENFFLRAKKDYQDKYFDSCRKYAKEARMLAEVAEYEATRKQNKMGGESPMNTAPAPFNPYFNPSSQESDKTKKGDPMEIFK